MTHLHLHAVVLSMCALGCGAAPTMPGTDAGSVPDARTSPGQDGGPMQDGGSVETDAGHVVIHHDGGPLPSGLTAAEQMLIDMPAGSWTEIPGTHMRDVTPPESSGVYGFEGPGGIINDYSGGAYDPTHRKMIVWGGGHHGYLGNELYAFDLPTMTWMRLTDPTPPSGGSLENADPLYDGNPASRHTYDELAYIEHANRFFAMGGAVAGDGGSTTVTWTFDVDARVWENRMPSGPTNQGGGFGAYNFTSAYDPMTRLIWFRTVHGIYTYDYDSNAWDLIDDTGEGADWVVETNQGYVESRSVLDPMRRILFTLGGGSMVAWDVESHARVTSSWTTTGGDAFIGEQAPGLDYDPITGELVGYATGNAWMLNLDTRTWRTGPAVPGPAPDETPRGTYGRWRYLALYNVYILVNAIDENVRFYKHTAGR